MMMATAQYPDSRPQYGIPAVANIYVPRQLSNPSPPQRSEQFQSAPANGAPIDLKVFRHVFVHSGLKIKLLYFTLLFFVKTLDKLVT